MESITISKCLKGGFAMTTQHFQFWPKHMPKTLTLPETTLYDNLVVSARRYPQKTAIYYYGTRITYQQLFSEVQVMSTYLSQQLNVQRGDRVLLYMQNSPQFVISFHAILASGAVVVPVNPMNLTEELAFYLEDSASHVAFVGQELYERIAPLLHSGGLEQMIVATYSDYLTEAPQSNVLPDVVMAPRQNFDTTGIVQWMDILANSSAMTMDISQPDDIAVLPYTSGTTGRPKGCIHTHRTVQANTVGAAVWSSITPNAVILTTLPLFHVTGMVHSMLAPIYVGSSIVIMTRWQRDVAAQLIAETQCTHWVNISTMVVDFLANPELDRYDLSSLVSIGGGGAPLPKAVGEKLHALTGVQYAEGYGLSETISQTHSNPGDRPKLQCMGIPSFNVDARIVDSDTLRELGPNEEGEVVVHGPQVFLGYWQREDENEKAFITIDGKKFFRTGDIAKYDEEGYYFIVDRVKRMINASGFKVWPTEVESMLYGHPDIEQACVIGVPDERRGETVKAFVVLKPDRRGHVSEQEIIEWAKGKMAAYKYPRIVEFIDQLPMSGTGKILWRVLQDEERKKQLGAS